jgi:EAL and modified HD-GYP domain-containing signal transduction protein
MQEEQKELVQLYARPGFAVLPIFDTRKLVWGYELSIRKTGKNDPEPSIGDRDLATLAFIGSFLMNPVAEGSRNKTALLLPYSDSLVLEGLPPELSHEPTVVVVQEEAAQRDGALETLLDLKKHQYHIAIDRLTGRPGYENLLEHASMAFVDVSEMSLEEIGEIVQKMMPSGVTPGAKGVGSQARFQEVRDLGFKLFQGEFFQQPELASGRKLSASTVAKFRLCHLLAEESPNLDELTQVIHADVALSYRFLSFVNSASFGFHQKIDSIKRAFVQIGWKNMKNWLWIMVIADIQPGGKTSELPYLCAIRGKFLENVAIYARRPAIKPGSIFLLGLFSLLEPMLDLPAEQIMVSLPLEERIKACLCHQENEYTDWLEMAKCFESGDWDKLDYLIDKLQLNRMKTASAYCQAVVWTKSFYSQPKEEARKSGRQSSERTEEGAASEAPASGFEATRSEENGLIKQVGAFFRSVLPFGKKK